MGVIGGHEEGFPIDNLCLNHDHTFLLSSSQSICKFWSMEEIPKMADQREKDVGEDEDEEKGRKRRKRRRAQVQEEQTDKEDFFADL